MDICPVLDGYFYRLFTQDSTIFQRLGVGGVKIRVRVRVRLGTSIYIIVRLQNTGIYRIYKPKTLSCGTQEKRDRYYKGHEGYKFRRSLCFEV